MNKLITMMTDWTYAEGAVGACKGVIKSIDYSLEIIDITHEIPAYDIYAASFRLKQVLPFWPKDTVFMVVVDPGVGTSRRPVVAKTLSGHFIVTPDNGTLTHINALIGFEEVRIIDTKHRLWSAHQTNVFHGRDIFAYVSAKLSSGQLSFEDVGEVLVDSIITFELKEPSHNLDTLHGMIEIVDPNFGNAWTNIPIQWLISLQKSEQTRFDIMITSKETTIHLQANYAPTFGHVSKGECVLYHNELDHVAIAINQESFIKTYNVSYGPEWIVEIRRTHD
jgi:S-adenosylmethionine hydrolase